MPQLWWLAPLAGGVAVGRGAVAVMERVMTPAEQRQVLDLGLAAVDPVHDVVRVGPIGRPVASGEGAPAAADFDRRGLQIAHHSGYEPRYVDFHDLALLHTARRATE